MEARPYLGGGKEDAMWRWVTWWFGSHRRIVRIPQWCDDRIWGGFALFLLPAMVLLGWLMVIAGTLTALLGIDAGVGMVVVGAIALPALPAMYAAGLIFAERMWATFGLYWLFGVGGRPIRAGWARYADHPQPTPNRQAPEQTRGG